MSTLVEGMSKDRFSYTMLSFPYSKFSFTISSPSPNQDVDTVFPDKTRVAYPAALEIPPHRRHPHPPQERNRHFPPPRLPPR